MLSGSFTARSAAQHALGRVAAERADVGDAVAHLEIGDAGADGDHFAGALVAGDERHADRRGIRAHAEIGVDEIDADRVLLDLDLALSRRRNLNVVECQDFGTAVFVDAHCRNHVSPL